MTRDLLYVEGLRAGYDGSDVIRDISFRLRSGDRLVILGPNGCGKTTLIRAVTGTLESEGILLSQGQDIRHMKPEQRAARMAVLAQLETAYFAYSVYDTVMMGRYHLLRRGWLSRPGEEDHAAVEASLRQVGLWEHRDRLITDLSGGQLQRVFLARTFAQEPSIIFLDEPTNHLDLLHQTELIAYLKQWSQEPGHAVCGVLHDLNLASELAGRVLLLDQGYTVAEGTWDEVCTPERLEAVFGMDVQGFMRDSLGRWM